MSVDFCVRNDHVTISLPLTFMYTSIFMQCNWGQDTTVKETITADELTLVYLSVQTIEDAQLFLELCVVLVATSMVNGTCECKQGGIPRAGSYKLIMCLEFPCHRCWRNQVQIRSDDLSIELESQIRSVCEASEY
jgi:hypothetical protein